MNDSHYCPHTPEEIREMLSVIGVASVEELFAPIPAELRAKTFNIPPGISEFETYGRMQAIAVTFKGSVCMVSLRQPQFNGTPSTESSSAIEPSA
jgi:glycine cleavage system pyridoxal-binding protein P